MEHIFKFLRPRTPEPSFDDLINEFLLTQEQQGEGVLTRRQARLAQTQPSAVQSSQPDELTSGTVPKPEEQPNVPLKPEQPSDPEQPRQAGQFNSEPDVSIDDDTISADDETAPYLKDTLVAENEDVYVSSTSQ
jgi:hypothetical protein